ncbi:TetR/AcrR family transcriptional regulator [Nocardiopsis sediminis]|uniref:TetR/AcrR family transcriptional regulator n=1 Tax=Nocardiopsis sediminis TaxID=1778267 RepID=A0ABV8FLB7_9ACTN
MPAAHPPETDAADPSGPPPGDTRSRLIAAASKLLGEGGPDAVTLRGVGERVGVSRTAPYRHFQGKNDLLTAVAVAEVGRLRDEIVAALEAGGDPPAMLHRVFTSFIRLGIQRPEHYRLIFGERLTETKDGELKTAAGALMQMCVAVFADGQRAGYIRSGDPHDLALLTWSSLHGLITLAISGHLAQKGYLTDTALARLVTELVAGLEPRSAP